LLRWLAVFLRALLAAVITALIPANTARTPSLHAA
jgi:hypothetical protein